MIEDPRIAVIRQRIESLLDGGADRGDYGDGQVAMAEEILDLLNRPTA